MEKERRKKITVIFLIIILMLCVYCAFRLLIHEKNQNQKIQDMQASISMLSAELDSIKEADIEWLSDGYNYLAIGNSITLHGVTSFWWNEIGMAASNEENDYFHLVMKYLETENEQVMGIPYNFSVWESQSHDRDETLSFLDGFLSPNINLITVQLAENASDLTTYQEDYVSLLEYIKKKAPNAKILVIGDFWSKENRIELKMNAADMADVEYISLEGITDNADYYCGLGTKVYDKDGNEHIVEHSGVANHPSDKGMQAIADRILEVLVIE